MLVFSTLAILQTGGRFHYIGVREPFVLSLTFVSVCVGMLTSIIPSNCALDGGKVSWC